MKLSNVIIILGRPGSGKGTQAKLLAKKFDLININAGGELRSLAKQDNLFAKKLQKVLDKGDLVPLWLIIHCVFNKLLNISLKKGVITEGIPREIEQAKFLIEALHWLGRKNIQVVYLHTNEKEVTERLLNRRICQKCGQEISLIIHKDNQKCFICGGKIIKRTDDQLKAIQQRMLIFRKKVIPVINYFKKQQLLTEVNGEGSIEEIHQRILKVLKN